MFSRLRLLALVLAMLAIAALPVLLDGPRVHAYPADDSLRPMADLSIPSQYLFRDGD